MEISPNYPTNPWILNLLLKPAAQAAGFPPVPTCIQKYGFQTAELYVSFDHAQWFSYKAFQTKTKLTPIQIIPSNTDPEPALFVHLCIIYDEGLSSQKASQVRTFKVYYELLADEGCKFYSLETPWTGNQNPSPQVISTYQDPSTPQKNGLALVLDLFYWDYNYENYLNQTVIVGELMIDP